MSNADPAFEELLEYLRDNRGFDFTGYKRASVMRRVKKRMSEVAIDDFAGYQDHLEVHPDEFTALFNTILINVTSFFRDPDSWQFVADEILPRIVESRGHEPIRTWSVGCASGEETYTLAMLIAEAVGLAEMRGGVKIYATDVDEEALEHARLGVYSASEVESIPAELREKYLAPANGGFVVRKELRRAVVFGRHDLVQDAPISRVDLIACRNTLIYFNAETQTRIYNGFHFALRPGGYLFLGKSEMLLTRTDIFEPVDLKRRVFARVPRSDRVAAFVPPAHVGAFARDPVKDRLRAGIFESSLIAQVSLDVSGVLVAVNGRARGLFGVRDSDIGRPFHELELSYRPIELRARIDRAGTEQRSNAEQAVPWTDGDGQRLYLDVEVNPILANGEQLGTSITFTDVTRPYEMTNELEGSRQELEEAYGQVQSTVEELETTNEELQSTNEELETTNEELQSTNEELETMNEELYSTNAELETINDELRVRTKQLDEATLFFESVMESIRAGVVVLDRDLRVESWNALAEDMWGLRRDEVSGKNLFALDFGLPVDQLQQSIRDCLSGDGDHSEIVVDATNRRGQSIRCKVVCSQLKDQADHVHGVILLLEAI